MQERITNSEDKIMAYKVKCSKCGEKFLIFTLSNQKPTERIKCTDCIEDEKMRLLKTRTLVRIGTRVGTRIIFTGISQNQFDTENRMIEVG